MDFYRNLETKVDSLDGATVSGEFWTERQDDHPDWLTAISRKP